MLPRILTAVVAGAVLGGVGGWAMLQVTRQVNEEAESLGDRLEEAKGLTEESTRVELDEPIRNEAWHYAQSVQRGDWDDVLRRVLWMRERLAYAELNEGGESGREAAQRELIATMADRSPGDVDNQWMAEGVEDWYVFSPFSEIEAVAMDEGRDDLERAVASRTWIRVTYADRATALRDSLNLPIRSIEVGVNVDEQGNILKANTTGNLDIEPDSIVYFVNEAAEATGGTTP